VKNIHCTPEDINEGSIPSTSTDDDVGGVCEVISGQTNKGGVPSRKAKKKLSWLEYKRLIKKLRKEMFG